MAENFDDEEECKESIGAFDAIVASPPEGTDEELD